MAEALGIVASVAQIASQLLGCIQQIHKFCKDVRDVPEELQLILKELQSLGAFFRYLDCSDDIDLNCGGLGFLKTSLAHCQTAAQTLETVATAAMKPLNESIKTKTLYRMKVALKKDEIKQLKDQLNNAKQNLQLAMACYQM
jgi:hypothetical protein